VLGVGSGGAVLLLAAAAAAQALPRAEYERQGRASLASEARVVDPEPLATELAGPQAPASEAETTQSLRVGAVGILLMQSAIAPGWSLDSGFGLSLDVPMSGLQPWFLLGMYFGTGKDAMSADGSATARFDHWAVYALGCPWRFDGAGSLAIRPCVDFDVGRSSGEGQGGAGEVKSSAPWLSAGVQLRAEVELWERLQLGVSAGGFIPLWHSSYSFPEVTTFEVPALGFRAGGFGSVLF